jgi:hypothetical protein
MRKRLAIWSVVLLVVSIFGLMGAWELNDTVFDKYDAYGEVPIPGTRTLHLPEGDVKVSFHTEIAGSMEGGGLPIPQDLDVAVSPPSGVATPKFIRGVGGTTAVNQDVHVPVGVMHIPAAGDYTITTNGKASAFISPRLSFGHGSSYGFVPWLFVGLGAVSLLTLLGLLVSALGSTTTRPAGSTKPKTALRQLEDIASLHNSGALSEEEYEAAKRRILDDS